MSDLTIGKFINQYNYLFNIYIYISIYYIIHNLIMGIFLLLLEPGAVILNMKNARKHFEKLECISTNDKIRGRPTQAKFNINTSTRTSTGTIIGTSTGTSASTSTSTDPSTSTSTDTSTSTGASTSTSDS